MSRTYTTTGIILKRRDYQENDRLFCIYTRDYGKIDVLAKGTKKITSKLNPYLEPGYYVQLMIAKGKFFDRLANCNLLNPFSNLRRDSQLRGFYLLNYLLEVTDGLILGQISDAHKFELFLDILDLLDKKFADPIGSEGNAAANLFLLANIYVLKLLNLLGYQPEIQRCLICHQGLLLTKNIFDFSQGGIICEKCKKICLLGNYLEVNDEIIKLMQLAQDQDLAYFIGYQITPQNLKLVEQIVLKLFMANLDRPIKSREFIKVVSAYS